MLQLSQLTSHERPTVDSLVNIFENRLLILFQIALCLFIVLTINGIANNFI